MINNTPLEIHEQEAVVEYLDLLVSSGKVVIFSAVPNNTFTKSWKQKAKMKREGVRRGVPDILVVLKDKIIFVEMKRVSGGVISSHQKEWIEAISKAGGHAKVCRGFNEAKKYIDSMVK